MTRPWPILVVALSLACESRPLPAPPDPPEEAKLAPLPSNAFDGAVTVVELGPDGRRFVSLKH